ncbi:MAG: hypothetical protein OEW58_13440 [Gammaproteobacteria bacterium]|nr:hypothetical protein [Gammaproteobacteria bacterium]
MMAQQDVGWGMGLGHVPLGWLFWALVVVGLVFLVKSRFFSGK